MVNNVFSSCMVFCLCSPLKLCKGSINHNFFFFLIGNTTNLRSTLYSLKCVQHYLCDAAECWEKHGSCSSMVLHFSCHRSQLAPRAHRIACSTQGFSSVPSHYSDTKELVQPSRVHRNYSLHLLLGAVNLNFSVGYFFS